MKCKLELRGDEASICQSDKGLADQRVEFMLSKVIPWLGYFGGQIFEIFKISDKVTVKNPSDNIHGEFVVD